MNNKILVCNKKDINLYKINEKDNIFFELEFIISNPNIIIKNVVNFKLFELMAELNKDIIEKQIIINTEDNYIDLLITFNKFSDDLGINKQYYSTRTTLIEFDDKTVFSSNNINIDKNKIDLDFSRYNLIKDSNNVLEFNYLNTNTMKCKYNFSMAIDEDLPSYMENMLGLLMKKVFFRLKTFIENI